MSHRRNLFNGRYPLRFESEKLDLLPLLPEEIRMFILLQLNYLELRQCMFVSKAWNKMVNSDYIWKKVCLTYGLEPDEDEKIAYNPKPPFGLCKWAYIWTQFRGSPSFGWKWRIWKTIHLSNGHRFSLVVSDGKSIVQCFKSSLCLWKSSELDKRRLNIKLLPVKIDSKCMVSVDNDYIAITKCNILLIYKWTEHKYDFILALSIPNQARTIDHYLLKRFISKELKEGTESLDIFAFYKGCIWIKNKNKTFVLNLDTLEIIRTLEFTNYYNIYRITKWYIISWSNENSRVRVDTFLGNNIFKIKKHGILNVLGNINVLIVLTIRNGMIMANTYDLGSGMPIVCWEFCRGLDHSFELHPSKNIVYKIKYNRLERAESNRMCAVDALTGKNIWTVLQKKYHSSGALKVICEQFLVFYNMQCQCLLVYNATTGERMYDMNRLEGRYIYLTDNVIISKDEVKNVYYIRSFLTRPY